MFKTHLGILKNASTLSKSLHVVNLNSPTVDIRFLTSLGKSKSTVIICDGAYNRILHHFDHENKDIHLIGDFDSIGKDTFTSVPSYIKTHPIEDQNLGDLEKALILSENLQQSSTESPMVIINGCSGSRFDHVM